MTPHVEKKQNCYSAYNNFDQNEFTDIFVNGQSSLNPLSLPSSNGFQLLANMQVIKYKKNLY